MNITDLFVETYTALTSNKVRSGLTVLGIVIGISSVIAMVSIGSGAQATIRDNISAIGSNLVLVTPGTQRGPGAQVSQGRGTARTLTQSDANAITSEISLAARVAPEQTGRYQVTTKGKNTNTSVIGTTGEYPQVRKVSVAMGAWFSASQVSSGAKVAVLGPTTRDDLFGEGVNPVGETVRIKGVPYKVVGVTASRGGTGFGNQDDMIFVTLSSAQRYLAGESYVTTISVEAKTAEDMTMMQSDITSLLLQEHRITDPAEQDFTVFNQQDIAATASSVTQTFTVLLSAIAGISLLVGGIGIMNMMLTTVTERTKEIGLRKAIGATERDIGMQFLLESVLLTLLGGVIGILFGVGVAMGVSSLGILKTEVPVSAVLLAFSVAGVIGIIFGYYPARRAAALDPISALRHE
jgi:putative ABC transport system permease protein